MIQSSLFSLFRYSRLLRSCNYFHSLSSRKCEAQSHQAGLHFPTLIRPCSSIARQVEIIYKDIDRSKYDVLHNNSSSEDNSSQIDSIIQQYEYIKYMQGHVPSDMSVENMKDLLQMKGERERASFLRHLFMRESRRMKKQLKKEARQVRAREYYQQRSPRGLLGCFDEVGDVHYGLWRSTLFERIGNSNITGYQVERKYRHASLFGQKLIFDLDYDDYMTLSEARIQVRHFVWSLQDNLSYIEPFDIYFTNCDYSKPTMVTMQKHFNETPLLQMDKDSHFLTKSYLDVFDRDRLVYLTPNAPIALSEYDHDDIYIVGGFLDKTNLNKPISHLKATKEGIRQYRLPIEKNVVWGSGASKNLCVMHMLQIMNSLKDGHDWKTTLSKHIPKRKIKDHELDANEQEARRVAYLKRKLSIANATLLDYNKLAERA